MLHYLQNLKKAVAIVGTVMVALAIVMVTVVLPNLPASAETTGTLPEGTDWLIPAGGSQWAAYEAAGERPGIGYTWDEFKAALEKTSCDAAANFKDLNPDKSKRKIYDCPSEGLRPNHYLRIPPAQAPEPEKVTSEDILACMLAAGVDGDVVSVEFGDGLTAAIERYFEGEEAAQAFYGLMVADTNAAAKVCEGMFPDPNRLHPGDFLWLSTETIDTINAELAAPVPTAVLAAVAPAAPLSGTLTIAGGESATELVTVTGAGSLTPPIEIKVGDVATLTITAPAPTPAPAPAAVGTRGLAVAPAPETIWVGLGETTCVAGIGDVKWFSVQPADGRCSGGCFWDDTPSNLFGGDRPLAGTVGAVVIPSELGGGAVVWEFAGGRMAVCELK